MPFPHRSHLTDSRIRSGPDAKENASAYERNDRNDQPDRPWMGKLLLSFQRQEALQPAGSVDNPKTVVTSCQAMAKHMLERVSHKKAAHGVQACQPCLADTFSSDRESPFMKAECGKTARSVCAADGGKPFTGRLLRPDSRWEGCKADPQAKGRTRGSVQHHADVASIASDACASRAARGRAR
jgi:hypothetical protein